VKERSKVWIGKLAHVFVSGNQLLKEKWNDRCIEIEEREKEMDG